MAFLSNSWQAVSGAFNVLGHVAGAGNWAKSGAVLGGLYGVYTGRGGIRDRIAHISNCAVVGAFVMTSLHVIRSMHQAEVLSEVDRRLGRIEGKVDALGVDLNLGARILRAMAPLVKRTHDNVRGVQIQIMGAAAVIDANHKEMKGLVNGIPGQTSSLTVNALIAVAQQRRALPPSQN